MPNVIMHFKRIRSCNSFYNIYNIYVLWFASLFASAIGN